ncbi:unnamed protein product, partial [Mesorhabditis belari]|uniref:Uncharacterized protein n=1 Tax=Mesorhabditis belari TaxID=2138241 RepID=A0AAF3J258_9BILA
MIGARCYGQMNQSLIRWVPMEKYNVVEPYSNTLPKNWIFQADNDPKHTSKKAKTFLTNQGWKILKWPPQSPDLSPIETRARISILPGVLGFVTVFGTILLIRKFSANTRNLSKRTREIQKQLFRATLVQAFAFFSSICFTCIIVMCTLMKWLNLPDIMMFHSLFPIVLHSPSNCIAIILTHTIGKCCFDGLRRDALVAARRFEGETSSSSLTLETDDDGCSIMVLVCAVTNSSQFGAIGLFVRLKWPLPLYRVSHRRCRC